ncbi:MAG: S8 family serine peptidase [Saprospiraceae bacterium]
MKKSILLLLTFMCFQLHTSAQSTSKKSAATLQYLAAEKAQTPLSKNSKFVYTKIANQQYLNAFAKVNDELSIAGLENLGILVGTKAGNIWTLKIPIENVEAFTNLENGIEQIQLDQPLFSNMDKAREKTNVDQVHEGTGLPQAFTGKDVVVGILDVGFDYTHPTFYDENGNNFRIKKVWEQKTSGTPPSSYSYGHEISDSLNIILQQTDTNQESHGSHVAGIAAGSGFGGDGDEYRGVAYESDLVFVGITPAQDQWLNTGMTDIVDGLNYIYEYAASQGKAAVANLSWGCSIGPHDGTSLFSQAVNNMTGEGKIFTISAGNNGGNNIHLNKQFSNTDTLLQSFVNFSTGIPDKKTWIDIWGENGESFCVQLATYNGLNLINATGFICLENNTIDTFLIGSDNDTLFLNLTTVDADINGKPHALLDIYSKTNNAVSLMVKSNSGTLNAWMGYVQETRGYYGEFVTNGLAGASAGDDQMTIGEMACTESAITVGAYASKINFTNLDGENLSYSGYVLADRICPFSSKGPTTDGRSKPDITAPGMTIASAMNSFDNSSTPGGASDNLLVHEYTDAATSHNYYFGESSGTSMSAPMTAGIIALMLEADPLLTPEDIISLLAETAILDNYTTDTPDADIWGFGKIDAYALMQTLFTSSLEEQILTDTRLYPNPTSGILNLDWEGAKTVIINNLIGETCATIKTSDNMVSLKSLNSGIYLVAVYGRDGELLTIEKIVRKQ